MARLIDSADSALHRTILVTLYATGVRQAELTNLKPIDIDSQRMVIHVRGGKGSKGRDVMLSPNLLDELRQHYRRLPRKPSQWLLPGGRWHTADSPIDTKVVWYACRDAVHRAAIDNPLHPHTLRHYATEMVRTGVSLPALMTLLGHVKAEMSMKYVQVAGDDLQREFLLARSRPRASGATTESASDVAACRPGRCCRCPIVRSTRHRDVSGDPCQTALPDALIGSPTD